MDKIYAAYIALLDEISTILEKLSGLAQEKAAAVRGNDLITLDQVLKQEQALSLNLRSLEQKRGKYLEQLNLSAQPLSQFAASCPPQLQMQAKKSVERLRTQYRLYQSAAEVARNTLECNLHEIEKILSDLGSDPVNGSGYAPQNAEPPKAMKTDFRA